MAKRDTTIRRVGSVRPSQLLYTFGIGSLIDLPSFSVVVGGLDDWDPNYQQRLTEERLLAAVRALPGMHKVAELREPPWLPEERDAFAPCALVGVPVSPFPRWLRCSACRLLAPIESGLFTLETWPYRPDRARYAHKGCNIAQGRPPSALPARFVTACSRGHLDEFPWMSFVHADGPCSGKPILEAVDTGLGTRSTDVLAKCRTCGTKRSVAQAFGDGSEKVLPRCRGRHPQLRRFDAAGCTEQATAMLVGASNAWFPVSLRVLSIPPAGDTIEQLVAAAWSDLERIPSIEVLTYALGEKPILSSLRLHPVAEVWAAIEAMRMDRATDGDAARDVESPEWHVFTHPETAPSGPDFTLTASSPPVGWEHRFKPSVRVDRLREVTAMVGFTRLDAPDPERLLLAPMASEQPTWVPASQTRGEGVFLRLDEDAVQAWEDRAAGTPRLEALRRSHQGWRSRRGLPEAGGWPGERYVLLHSLAHGLINELALECGYPAASIRERIYSRERGLVGDPMAGILLYTAAPDSEGTLGGLIAAGDPARLGLMVSRIADRGACASDPMCAEHVPSTEDHSLHGAACHACMFIPETSCERGNRYLDRTTLAATMADLTLGFLA